MFLSFDKAALPSLPQWRRIAGITAMACASLWLAGCAGVRTIDSDVQLLGRCDNGIGIVGGRCRSVDVVVVVVMARDSMDGGGG
jgi:hypothetical protein